jgi:two-component system, chemotaxis family, sensor histidine kinase and response regulator WspE
VTAQDLSQLSMHDLFRLEAESQTQLLTAGLLALERNPVAPDELEACMRAAHSLKGAARIVDIDAGVALAHAMEDFLIAAQHGRITLDQEQIDLLLNGVDLMMAIARSPDLEPGKAVGARRPEVDAFIVDLNKVLNGKPRAPTPAEVPPAQPPEPSLHAATEPAKPVSDASTPGSIEQRPEVEADTSDRALRVTVDNLNRLLGLAGETLVETRWIKPFGESLLRLKRLQSESARALDKLREALTQQTLDARAEGAISDAQRRMSECQTLLTERLSEIDTADRQSTRLAHRLYDQALACRMRPFGDGAMRYPRMVRDVGRSLGKQVRLDIAGASTQVDRDILAKLDAPLGHLLRNAVDHGIELSDQRVAAGKPAEGVVSLEAHHHAGALQIVVSDDGLGIDLDRLRKAIVERRLANAEMAGKLSDAELLEFLFLPGFSMKETVTEISGRGVGLDVVQDMVKEVRGVVRISSEPGRGTRFHLQLPLTLSVIRTLLVEIAGEPYAFPLAHIGRAIKLARERIETLEGRQYFSFEGQQIGLVTAHQVLQVGEHSGAGNELAVIIVGEQQNRYGLVVDRLIGRRELVVHPLDARLGKVKDISAAALMEDGTPLLIVDVEDVVRSMEKLAHADRLERVQHGAGDVAGKQRKRVLVVDDSLTVRLLERKLLEQHGYEVEIAVDGMDGWNAVRGARFDLIITDIDMPRMDGIELITLIKRDPQLKSLPVMIVSYKDREEDRRRGLEAGADYYLTKGSFHDDALRQATVDLIGEASP